MRFRIHRHRAGSALCPNRLHDRELVRIVLVHHGDRSFPVRSERESGARIESGGIDTRAHRRARDNLPRSHVDNRHCLVAASCEKSLVHAVDRQPTRLLARREWPTGFHCQRLWIEDGDHALVFQIRIDLPAFAHRSLRCALKVDSSNH